MTNTHETQITPTDPERTSFWHRKPTLWIGGGLAAAALVAGGIGVASAAGDDDNDVRPAATQPLTDESDGDLVQEPAVAAGATYGANDASAIADVLAAAAAQSKGTPTSMEAHRDGSWSVDFDAANGDETTVLVASDGKASVVRTERADRDDANDPAPAGQLTEQSIASAVKATFGKANGVIVGIDLDDKPAEAYSVEVLASNGVETEIDLNTDFDITRVENDKDNDNN